MQKISNFCCTHVNIGHVKIVNQIFLAPMAGFTDLPFRLICKKQGCGLAFTEMISARGIIYNNKKTLQLLNIEKNEKPIAVQIFGSDPLIMASAAKFIAEKGADIIDINMGCPANKIVKNREGSALMREPKLAYEIMARVTNAVKIPVTIKIRKGWDDNLVNALEIATLAEHAGIAAITVHGRTREQFYSGIADWDVIRNVKTNVKIPVIGNGDIFCPSDAKKMLQYTTCDAIMIGRGCLGNPWIFQRVLEYLKSGKISKESTDAEKFKMILYHFNSLIKYKGYSKAIREIKSHIFWYTKGMYRASEIRFNINKALCHNDFVKVLEEFKLCKF